MSAGWAVISYHFGRTTIVVPDPKREARAQTPSAYAYAAQIIFKVMRNLMHLALAFPLAAKNIRSDSMRHNTKVSCASYNNIIVVSGLWCRWLPLLWPSSVCHSFRCARSWLIAGPSWIILYEMMVSILETMRNSHRELPWRCQRSLKRKMWIKKHQHETQESMRTV